MGESAGRARSRSPRRHRVTAGLPPESPGGWRDRDYDRPPGRFDRRDPRARQADPSRWCCARACDCCWLEAGDPKRWLPIIIFLLLGIIAFVVWVKEPGTTVQGLTPSKLQQIVERFLDEQLEDKLHWDSLSGLSDKVETSMEVRLQAEIEAYTKKLDNEVQKHTNKISELYQSTRGAKDNILKMDERLNKHTDKMGNIVTTTESNTKTLQQLVDEFGKQNTNAHYQKLADDVKSEVIGVCLDPYHSLFKKSDHFETLLNDVKTRDNKLKTDVEKLQTFTNAKVQELNGKHGKTAEELIKAQKVINALRGEMNGNTEKLKGIDQDVSEKKKKFLADMKNKFASLDKTVTGLTTTSENSARKLEDIKIDLDNLQGRPNGRSGSTPTHRPQGRVPKPGSNSGSPDAEFTCRDNQGNYVSCTKEQQHRVLETTALRFKNQGDAKRSRYVLLRLRKQRYGKGLGRTGSDTKYFNTKAAAIAYAEGKAYKEEEYGIWDMHQKQRKEGEHIHGKPEDPLFKEEIDRIYKKSIAGDTQRSGWNALKDKVDVGLGFFGWGR